MNLTHLTKRLVLRVYTVSFRKVLEQVDSSGTYFGEHDMSVLKSRFDRLASGVYYYRIEGESTGSEKAYSPADKFVIIR